MMTNAMYDSNVFSSMVLSTVKSSIFHEPNNINYIWSNNDDRTSYLYEDNNSNNASMTTILDYSDNKYVRHVNANYSSSNDSFDSLSSGGNVIVNLDSETSVNYWALLALVLVFGTAGGNILVCLAIYYEKRLQNVTNYFLASLALTDLMVAVLVMPLGILTLYRGYFPLKSVHCLVWICLDVLFCTASIMHLCTISIDRYLSLRYPMRFGRNKTRKRVVLKIIFVWLLSIAMSLPLSLMYSKDHASVLVEGTCQIPDPVYKFVGSIVCFYIPLTVMLLTYTLTVRLLAHQRQSLGGVGGVPKPTSSGLLSSGWLGIAPPLERKNTWKRFVKSSLPSTPNHAHSAASTDTDLSTLEINTHELWLPESSIPEPTPSTMTALHQFGAEMLKLSRGLESFTPITEPKNANTTTNANIAAAATAVAEPSLKAKVSSINNFEPSSSSTMDFHINNNNNVRSHLEERKSKHNICGRAENNHNNKRIICMKPQRRRASLNVFHSHSRSSTKRLKRSNSIQAFTPNRESSIDEYFFDEINQLKRQQLRNKKQTVNKSKRSRDNEGDSTSLELPPPCTCPYFGDKPCAMVKPIEVKIITTSSTSNIFAPTEKNYHQHPFNQPSPHQFMSLSNNSISSNSKTATSTSSLPMATQSIQPQSSLAAQKLTGGKQQSGGYATKCNSVVTWDSKRYQRRGSSVGGSARTTLLLTPTKSIINSSSSPLRRSVTLRHNTNVNLNSKSDSLHPKIPSSPCILQRSTTIRSHHSRNSSVISRNSSRHGRIIRLEQKATKVLGVVFFTFVILWAPFFVLNLLPTVCPYCEECIGHGIFDFVTWLGYASSMVNPIFYTIFNKVFRQAFKKVLLCQYRNKPLWKPVPVNNR